MKQLFFFISVFLCTSIITIAQSPYPVRGLCIGIPSAKNIDEFAAFIANDLAPSGLNVLILRIDYQYQFKSHPELIAKDAYSESDIKKFVKVCKENNIRLIPQINLLGHQSAGSEVGKLLEVYPEFDETPDIKFPKKGEYKWPNSDRLYCKSYCPLNPEVHKIVFDLVDEICNVFESNAFHAGMDEVFYIGHENCSRCFGHDKADLFAGEVVKIHNHLKVSKRELWIWGDRLLDGKTTGLGEWEASYNSTFHAIDMIPKDIIICDWHYERPDPTAVIFASKGFGVVSCPFRETKSALDQEKMMRLFIEGATKEMKPNYMGMVQTTWDSAEGFMKSYKGTENPGMVDKSGVCFRELTKVWNQ